MTEAQISNQPATRRENRENRFFDRAMDNIPRNAHIMFAIGSFQKNSRSVSYIYRHAGRTFTTTLKTESGEIWL